MDFSVTERERRTPAPQAEQRLSDTGRLCSKNLYAMKLPFSHSPSVIKPSQAMRTARHQHGGRCNSYGNRYAACSSGMSVNIKSKSKQRDSRAETRQPYGDSNLNRRGCYPFYVLVWFGMEVPLYGSNHTAQQNRYLL